MRIFIIVLLSSFLSIQSGIAAKGPYQTRIHNLTFPISSAQAGISAATGLGMSLSGLGLSIGSFFPMNRELTKVLETVGIVMTVAAAIFLFIGILNERRKLSRGQNIIRDPNVVTTAKRRLYYSIFDFGLTSILLGLMWTNYHFALLRFNKLSQLVGTLKNRLQGSFMRPYDIIKKSHAQQRIVPNNIKMCIDNQKRLDAECRCRQKGNCLQLPKKIFQKFLKNYPYKNKILNQTNALLSGRKSFQEIDLRENILINNKTTKNLDRILKKYPNMPSIDNIFKAQLKKVMVQISGTNLKNILNHSRMLSNANFRAHLFKNQNPQLRNNLVSTLKEAKVFKGIVISEQEENQQREKVKELTIKSGGIKNRPEPQTKTSKVGKNYIFNNIHQGSQSLWEILSHKYQRLFYNNKQESF